MRTSVLLLLVVCAVSMHVKIEEEFVHSHSVHKRLHHNANYARQQVTGEFTKNDAKPELIDTQLIVPITLGKQEVKLVLDSTEAGTWVQSRKPSSTEGVCEKCPTTTTPFQCTGSCTVDPDPPADPAAKTPTPFAGYTTAGFQGRISVVDYTAVEKKTVVAGSSIKDFRFGLVAKLDGTATDLANVLPNRGALGFGIGKTRVQKYKDQKNQVNPLKADKPLTEQANLVRTLHQQNKGIITKASVSIKLEDGLNIVTFGQSEGYFKQGQTQTYDNQATDNDNYQLLLSEFGYGSFPDEPTPAQVAAAPATIGTPTPAPAANGATQAVLDTTGRFFYFTEPFVTNLVTVLNREGKACVAPTDTEPLISCTCTDKEGVKKFKPLSLRFNNKKYVHRVQPQNYVQFVNGKCFVGVQKTENPVATIGNVFFRDNYVTFNQDTTNVEISDAYPVSPSPLTMNQNDRYAFVVIGLVLALGSVLTLLSILKQIGFVPLTQSRVQAPEPVKTAPPPTQSVVYAYAPQPVYQQVVVGNPVYGQQPISSRSRNLPPGQYIR